jgi:hypothetical protein
VIDTREADMPEAITLSKQRHAGYIYITNDGGSNPWGTLPKASYWEKEQELVNQVNEVKPIGFNPSIFLMLF